MSQSVVVEIAKAVVTRLNTESYCAEFTAKRAFLPIFDLPAMDTLHATVVPREIDSEAFDRARDAYDYGIDIAIQQKVASDEEVESLLKLVEEIADSFSGLSLTIPGPQSARCVKTSNSPVYSQEHLSELNQFTSVLSLTFRVFR